MVECVSGGVVEWGLSDNDVIDIKHKTLAKSRWGCHFNFDQVC